MFIFCVGIYFDVPEITPNAVGIFRFNSNNDLVNNFILHLLQWYSVCACFDIIPWTKLLTVVGKNYFTWFAIGHH